MAFLSTSSDSAVGLRVRRTRINLTSAMDHGHDSKETVFGGGVQMNPRY